MTTVGIIKKQFVHVDASEVDRPRTATPGRDHGSKTARLVRLEGRVVGLEFTCSCGQNTFVELEFDGDAAIDEEA